MKLTARLTWLLWCISTSAGAQEKKYTVHGYLNGADVPMQAFLSFRDGSRLVWDSTMAKNNRFTFSGAVEHPAEATIYVHRLYPPNVKPTLPLSEGLQFMLDHGTTTIEGKRLQTAKIDGGEVQKEYVAFRESINAVRDSVYRIWKAQQDVLPEDSAAAFKRLLYAQNKIIRDATKDFVRAHPGSALAFNILQTNTVFISDVAFVEPMLEALRPEFGKYERYKAIEQKINVTKRLAIGQRAMDFTQADDKGKMVSLSDVRGKYVLIDFWASWCGPCRAEYPFLKKAYARFKDKNFEIIGISIDDEKSQWLDAIRSNGFGWIQLSDLKGRENAVAKAYGISAIPQSLLIDPQGKIVAKNLRGEELISKLEELMQ